MSLPPPRVRALVGALAALLATSCMAGQAAVTSETRPVTKGTWADLGPVLLRDVYLVPASDGLVPVGGDAELVATLVNIGSNDDRLVGIRTDQARQVVAAGTVPLPAGRTVHLAPPSVLPGGEEVRVTGFVQQAFTGSSVALTFQFARAGTVTMQVPVASPSDTTATATPIPVFSFPSESPPEVPTSASPSASATVAPGSSPTPSASISPTPTPVVTSTSPSPSP